MADVSKISLYGTSYNVKDSTARSAASSANQAATSAAQEASTAKTIANNALSNSETNTTNISKVASESVKVVYIEKSETIEVTKGISF